MKVKWMMTQPKPMLMRRNRRVEGCQICRVKVKVVEGLRSKKTDRRVEKRGSGQVVEHVPRGKLAKGVEAKNRQSRSRNIKLILRGSVEHGCLRTRI